MLIYKMLYPMLNYSLCHLIQHQDWAEEYIDCESNLQTNCELDDVAVLDNVKDKKSEEDPEEMKNDESKEPEVVTASQALQSYTSLVAFIEQNGQFGDEQIKIIRDLKAQLELSLEASKKQSNIDNNFKKI